MSELRAPEQDIVLTSRVRLARNYNDIPFMPKMNEEWMRETVRRATEAMHAGPDSDHYELVRMADITPDERTQLVEHHLISYDLLKFSDRSAALISTGSTVSIMINEEDHLRIQGLMPGLQIERSADLAFKADNQLSSGAEYAFDAQWGYLTSCPTNTGTGMRASTMLHLPALSAAGQIGSIVQMVSKLGLTVRGLYGEGSDAKGNLYQLSNQVTLGRTEEDTIKSLVTATQQIAAHERTVREKIQQQDPIAMMDKLMRSIGILAHARIMPLQEFMNRYSDLRLAAAIDLINAPLFDLDEMMMNLQPASIAVRVGKEMTDKERDIVRADLAREVIGKIAHGV